MCSSDLHGLYWGKFGFTSSCGGAHTAGAYGAICIHGTKAPFYSGYAASGTDYCSDGTQNFDATPCSASRLFSIGAR